VTVLHDGAGGSTRNQSRDQGSRSAACDNHSGTRTVYPQCAQEAELTFDILTDLHQKIAEQFRLVFVLPDYLHDLYKSNGMTLDRFHDESEYRLPMPARYVIDQGGIIRGADLNADYTIRPEPAETVGILRGADRLTIVERSLRTHERRCAENPVPYGPAQRRLPGTPQQRHRD
jgi:hypothetical protein